MWWSCDWQIGANKGHNVDPGGWVLGLKLVIKNKWKCAPSRTSQDTQIRLSPVCFTLCLCVYALQSLVIILCHMMQGEGLGLFNSMPVNFLLIWALQWNTKGHCHFVSFCFWHSPNYYCRLLLTAGELCHFIYGTIQIRPRL